MTTMLIYLVTVAALLAGCGGTRYSEPSASPDTWTIAQCESQGGYWNRTAGVCEGRLSRFP